MRLASVGEVHVAPPPLPDHVVVPGGDLAWARGRFEERNAGRLLVVADSIRYVLVRRVEHLLMGRPLLLGQESHQLRGEAGAAPGRSH